MLMLDTRHQIRIHRDPTTMDNNNNNNHNTPATTITRQSVVQARPVSLNYRFFFCPANILYYTFDKNR